MPSECAITCYYLQNSGLKLEHIWREQCAQFLANKLQILIKIFSPKFNILTYVPNVLFRNRYNPLPMGEKYNLAFYISKQPEMGFGTC